MLLIICRSRYASKGHRSGLWRDDTGTAGLADRSTTTDVKGDQIGDRIESLVFKLILCPFVNRVRLDDDLQKYNIYVNLELGILKDILIVLCTTHSIDDEVKRLTLPSYCQNVVARLGSAITY